MPQQQTDNVYDQIGQHLAEIDSRAKEIVRICAKKLVEVPDDIEKLTKYVLQAQHLSHYTVHDTEGCGLSTDVKVAKEMYEARLEKENKDAANI